MGLLAMWLLKMHINQFENKAWKYVNPIYVPTYVYTYDG